VEPRVHGDHGHDEVALPGPPGGTDGPAVSGNETVAHKGQLVGDKVIWQVVTVNWEANVVDNAASLAVASATTDEPVRVIEDSRCAGAHVAASTSGATVMCAPTATGASSRPVAAPPTLSARVC
jgi:hypothetical protein